MTKEEADKILESAVPLAAIFIATGQHKNPIVAVREAISVIEVVRKELMDG